MNQDGNLAVRREQVAEQLDRILRDPLFSHSQRLSVLLRFIVDRTLDGRSSELKEAVIGSEAFQRGREFDPQIDNLVRVTAGRLRSRLAEYYQVRGSGDAIVIALPRGGYVPTIAIVERPVQDTLQSPQISGLVSDSPGVGLPVGRSQELSQLHSAFAEAAKGTSRLIAISGEAGIGKTALIDAFLAEAGRSGSAPWAFRGCCSERLSRTEPFLPVLDCLEDLIQGPAAAEARSLMERTAPSWLGRLDSSGVRTAPEQSAERFRREFVRFLKALSDSRPIVIALDDLHWIDESSVDLLVYLTSHLKNLNLLLLAAYRPAAILSADPFISLKISLQREGILRELTLPRLSLPDVEAYVSRYFPAHRLPGEFSAAVHQRSEGHPLFMREMLLFLSSRGMVTRVDGAWELRGSISEIQKTIPAGARSLIELEIARIEPEDRRILECAAVQGVIFDSVVVSKAAGLEAEVVEERLRRLSATHRFIALTGDSNIPAAVSWRFRFLHVLYQNALYADIPPSRRVSLSLAVAAALMEYGAGTAAGIALLFESGRQSEGAARNFLRASRQAIAVFAYPETVLLCRRGLGHLLSLPESKTRDARELEFSLIEGLALMITHGYAAPEVERVYRRSRELCLRLQDQRQLVAVMWGIHTCLVNAGELTQALELANEMKAIAAGRNDTEGLIQSFHALGTTLGFMGETTEARAALEEALRLLRSNESKGRRSLFVLDTEVTLLSMLGRALALEGSAGEALSKARSSLGIANRLDHPPSIVYAQFWIGWIHHHAKQFDAACDSLEEAMRLSRKFGLPQFLEWSRIVHGSSLARGGRIEEGIAEMRLSLENQLSMRCLLERPYCLTLLAEALLASGMPEEALARCEEALGIAQRTGARSYERETLMIRRAILHDLKRPAEAAGRPFA